MGTTLVASGVGATAASAAPNPAPTVINSVGAFSQVAVPAGVCEVEVIAVGAGGGNPGWNGNLPNQAQGGAGASIAATFAVTEGTQISGFVGGGGQGGGPSTPRRNAGGVETGGAGGEGTLHHGGGGGGLTSVSIGADEVIVAGGGGGAGGGHLLGQGFGGHGGLPTQDARVAAGEDGGYGGDSSNRGSSTPYVNDPTMVPGGGQGGQVNGPGAGGDYTDSQNKLPASALPGILGVAGDGRTGGAGGIDPGAPGGGDRADTAGGGGGGFFGGGGGSGTRENGAGNAIPNGIGAAGGGGGSSWVSDAARTVSSQQGARAATSGANGPDGSVVLNWIACPEPGLDLRKTSNPGQHTPVSAGQTITYMVEAENTGETALETVVKDDLSQVLAHSGSPTVLSTEIDNVGTTAATISGDELSWTGTLQPGQLLTITYSVVVNEDAAGATVKNLVTASGTPPTGPPVTPPAVEIEHPVAGFEITKTADPASGTTVEPGETITYTVTGTNTGATLLDPATISDNLAGVLAHAAYNGDVTASTGTADITGTTLNWNGSLTPGQDVVITYSVTVNADASGVVLNNVVNGSATPQERPDPDGPTIPGTPIVPPTVETEHPVLGSGFAVTKSADPESGTAVNAGDTITYTVTGTNTGETVLDPASISDDLSGVLAHAAYNGDVEATRGSAAVAGDTLTWSGSLAPGQDVIITYSVTVDEDASGVLIHNVAQGEATPQIPDPSDPDGPGRPGTPIETPEVETQHPVVNPALEVTKSADPESGTAVNAGDTIMYTVTGTNTGDTVLDPASITDDLTAVLAHAAYNGDVVASTGSASVIDNTLNWSGALGKGDSVTITYSVTVDEDASGVLIHNVAQGSGTPLVPTDPSDPDSPTTPGTPIETPEVETEHPVVNPGFEVTKSADPASGTNVDPGSVITYTVTGTNTGDTLLDPASISDDLSGVLAQAAYNGDVEATRGSAEVSGDTLNWNGALAPGQDVTITYSVTVNGDAGGEVLHNRASGTATPQLPEDPTDPDSPTTPGTPLTPPPVVTEHPVNEPGFALTKSVAPVSGTAVDPGTVLTYTVTGVNTGETVLNPVDIVDDLSGVLEHAAYNDDAAATINGDAAAAPEVSGEELSWSGSLAVGETVTITYSVTVNGDAGGEVVRNSVSGEATPPGGETLVPPPVDTNNPVNKPGFSVSKSADPASGTAVDPGSVITYTVTGVNTGETVLNPVDIVDDLSGVLEHAAYNDDAAATINGNGAAAPEVSGEELSWSGSLAVGETVTITYSVTVNGDAGGETLENRVVGEATPPGGEPPIVTPPSVTEHPVKEPGFELEKTANPASGTAVDPGSVVTYTVTGINTGETVLSPVSIEDDLSDVLAHAAYNGDVAATSGDVAIDGTELSWTGGLEVGERVTITYSVTVNGDAGGEILENVATGRAVPPGGTELTPPPSSTEHPVNKPGFEFTKSANPKSGTSVATGSVVTYTLTGVNTGQTALNPVTIDDDLSQVLKYAKYQGDAVAKIGGRTVGAPVVQGGKLSWTGALQVGETVTVTYSVKVNETAAGQKLKNVAVASATVPGGEVITPPKSSTEHPVKTPLAVTGERAMPWLAALGALLAAGGGFLLVTRRRRSTV